MQCKDKKEGKGGFLLLAVDADAKLRYDRIVARASATDKVTFETFVENEQREMTNTDPTKQNLSECMRMANTVIRNDGSLDELIEQIDAILLDNAQWVR